MVRRKKKKAGQLKRRRKTSVRERLMEMAKKGLGRGLGAIFGSDSDTAARAKTVTTAKRAARKSTASGGGKTGAEDGAEGLDVMTGGSGEQNVSRETSKIRLSLIEPNAGQPRKNFDEESLQELADSIREHGVLQPIIVRQNGAMYEIVVGERRWRAARMAGLTEIPAIVREVAGQEAAEIALIENIQREDLGTVEEARAYRALIDEYGLTQEELAKRVFKNRTTITNSLRLLQLDDDVLQFVEDGSLSAGHARAILAVNGKRAQYKAAREVINNSLSVREAEKLAKAYNAEQSRAKKEKPVPEKDIYLEELESGLADWLQTKVRIHRLGKEKGRIEIEYYSVEELEQLVGRLSGAGED